MELLHVMFQARRHYSHAHNIKLSLCSMQMQNVHPFSLIYCPRHTSPNMYLPPQHA
jgi:hypothetical protein